MGKNHGKRPGQPPREREEGRFGPGMLEEWKSGLTDLESLKCSSDPGNVDAGLRNKHVISPRVD